MYHPPPHQAKSITKSLPSDIRDLKILIIVQIARTRDHSGQVRLDPLLKGRDLDLCLLASMGKTGRGMPFVLLGGPEECGTKNAGMVRCGVYKNIQHPGK
jgi:hypothetical protein